MTSLPSFFSADCFSFVCLFLGNNAGVHPATPRVKHDCRRHREVHPDQGREAPERQIRRPTWQTPSVSHSWEYLMPILRHQTVGELFKSNLLCAYAFRNGYSMFCAELMSNMKDVPSTERMVMCSQRWKLLKQGEKDAYQKRCEQVSSEPASHTNTKKTINVIVSKTVICLNFLQRKKEFEIEMNRFLSVSVVVALLCRLLNLCL